MGIKIITLRDDQTLENLLEEQRFFLPRVFKIEGNTLTAELTSMRSKKLDEKVLVFLGGLTTNDENIDRINLNQLKNFFSEGEWGKMTNEQLLNMKPKDLMKKARGLGPQKIESLKFFFQSNASEFHKFSMKEFPLFQK
jgi:hypothetical protein